MQVKEIRKKGDHILRVLEKKFFSLIFCLVGGFFSGQGGEEAVRRQARVGGNHLIKFHFLAFFF